MFRTKISLFRRDGQGQDLAEYCLLMALVALIALGLLSHFSGGLGNIWSSTNDTLASGSQAAGAQPASAQPASGQPSSGGQPIKDAPASRQQ